MTDLRPHYQFAIIGGGLAGSTLGTLLARSGRDVVLFEKDDFPRDKLCGEFLSPESQAILDELGLRERLAQTAPRIRHARFTAPSGALVHASLPAPALGVSRLRLDQALFDAANRAGAHGAAGHKVVELHSDSAVHRLGVRGPSGVSEVTADTVICAYGRRTKLDRAQGRDFMDKRHPYVGFKRHHRVDQTAAGQRTDEELRDHVEIHGFEGGYCGMSHIETGEVNVCMLLEQRFVDRLDRAAWSNIAAAISDENPRLAARLAGLEPSEDGMHAVAQVPFDIKDSYRNGVFFCGDAAGMIAPLTGDGQAMALESARLLADILLELPETPSRRQTDAVGQRWATRWRVNYEARLRLGRRLQWLLFRRIPLEIGVRAAGAVPGLADALARWTRSAA
ncbi:MAG: NAD(P)/FAD-dependent oxidoreductase [Myxococcota bacterium]